MIIRMMDNFVAYFHWPLANGRRHVVPEDHLAELLLAELARLPRLRLGLQAGQDLPLVDASLVETKTAERMIS